MALRSQLKSLVEEMNGANVHEILALERVLDDVKTAATKLYFAHYHGKSTPSGISYAEEANILINRVMDDIERE